MQPQNFPETKINGDAQKLKGASFFAILLLASGLVLIPGTIIGVGFGGSKLVFILPVFLLIGSGGLFARKKWSLYFITPAVLFWYYFFTTNGGRTTWFNRGGMVDNFLHLIHSHGTIQLILGFSIFLFPLFALIYLWKGYKNLR